MEMSSTSGARSVVVGALLFVLACSNQPATAPPGVPADGGTDAQCGNSGGASAMSGNENGGAAGADDAPGAAGDGGAPGAEARQPLEELQRAYVDLRFGMFVHFGILTYTGQWAEPNLDISLFDPTNLDAEQWADAALSAKMTYGVLTTRHHDGFALWDSQVSDFDVGSIPWRNGQGDVVREFVDAFRRKGLLPGLYYSVWDATRGVGGTAAGGTSVTPEDIEYVKAQLTELLTGYGPIAILVFDGWSWQMGHRRVAYQEIRELVKSLQPNCLMMDHTHLLSPWNADVAAIEEPKGAFVAASNTYPATQGQKIVSGNDWFWAPESETQEPLSVSSIVEGHLAILETRWTNFLLNCPPNRDGLLDPNIVDRLAEVGSAWSPDPNRAPLPAQGPQNEHPYTPVAATATSGVADYAIDGKNDYHAYSVWQSRGAMPQSVTLDLGEVKPDVGILNYVPRYVGNLGPNTDGAITSYAVLVSEDGVDFRAVKGGTWPSDTNMKVATFCPVAARFVRLQANRVNGTNAAATEISVGAVR